MAEIIPLSESENLCRIIFSPYHVTTDFKPKYAAFLPPYECDEVSVNRLKYIDRTFCKVEGQKIEKQMQNKNPSAKKKYQGLVEITVEKIFSAGAKAKPTPRDYNLAHADIYYGILRVRDFPVPSILVVILKKLEKEAIYLRDNNPQSNKWE
ncbi:MAG: hypothetical protein IPQ05_18265 [Leptospiraceae bacterium]|nr:hypothetical protein [Leptospiraceae bacterium]